jgi:hypothetical protein
MCFKPISFLQTANTTYDRQGYLTNQTDYGHGWLQNQGIIKARKRWGVFMGDEQKHRGVKYWGKDESRREDLNQDDLGGSGGA